MAKLEEYMNDPKFLAVAGPLFLYGAAKQKKVLTEEARDRKAVTAAVDAFWKKASLDARRAFLKQLEDFAPEGNRPRLQRFGANLTEAEQVATPAAPTSPSVVKKDADKAE